MHCSKKSGSSNMLQASSERIHLRCIVSMIRQPYWRSFLVKATERQYGMIHACKQ